MSLMLISAQREEKRSSAATLIVPEAAQRFVRKIIKNADHEGQGHGQRNINSTLWQQPQ